MSWPRTWAQLIVTGRNNYETMFSAQAHTSGKSLGPECIDTLKLVS
jgi:hypothetical protein